jgi:hypothetical protein
VRPLKTALVAADNLLPLWLAGQRPRQSLLVRCRPVTAASLAGLVARGEFLEGLFRRLGAVQFDLTTGECSA